MAIIKIKELVSKTSKANGNNYVIVKDETDSKYFCWTPEILNGMKVGDEIEITTTAGKNDAVYITAAEKVMDEPIPDYDEDDIPEPDFEPVRNPIPQQRQSQPNPIQKPQSRPNPTTPMNTTPIPNPRTSVPNEPKPIQRPTVPAAPTPAPAPVTNETYSEEDEVEHVITGHSEYEPDTEFVNTPNMEVYNKVKTPPQNALKPFDNGRFAGTDINPMWRIKKLTEIYGPAGFGWYYTIDRKTTEYCEQTKETKAFVDISLFVKDPKSGEWSKPIAGTGGNSYCYNTKKGPVCSDECYKSATTDALGNACKSIGIGADVYWQEGATKYNEN